MEQTTGGDKTKDKITKKPVLLALAATFIFVISALGVLAVTGNAVIGQTSNPDEDIDVDVDDENENEDASDVEDGPEVDNGIEDDADGIENNHEFEGEEDGEH